MIKKYKEISPKYCIKTSSLYFSNTYILEVKRQLYISLYIYIAQFFTSLKYIKESTLIS